MYTLRHTDDPVYASVPPESVASVLDAAMKAKIAAYQSGEAGKLLRAGDVTVGDVGGKECAVAVEKPMRGTNWARFFIVGGQYYDVMVFVAASSGHDEHERFFSSFKPLVKP